MKRQLWIAAMALLSFTLGPTTAIGRANFDVSSQSAAKASGDHDPIKQPDGPAYFNPPKSCHLLQTGMVSAYYNNMGQIGTGYFDFTCCDDLSECPSFESPPSSGLEYLFSGAVWFGGVSGTDTLVSVGADGWYNYNELLPAHPALSFDYISDGAFWTTFVDTFDANDYWDLGEHQPIGLRGVLKAYYWTDEPANGLIIYDLILTNISEVPISEGYVGIFIDGDAYHRSINDGFVDDIVGSFPNERIAYSIDNDGDPTDSLHFGDNSPTRALGCKILSSSFNAPDTSFNWWISYGNPIFDFGPRQVDEFGNPNCLLGGDTIRSGTPTNDHEKYCLLSNGEWDYDLIRMADSLTGWEPARLEVLNEYMSGGDVRFLMSLGPVDLLPDSSIRMIFTTFTGWQVHLRPDNLQNLPHDPDQYQANLFFNSILANGELADILADSLLNPSYPPTGMFVQCNNTDSVVVEWDPWVYDDIEGSNLYLYQIPFDSIPYSCIAPPWLHLELDSFTQVSSVGRTYRHCLDSLTPHRFYAASVAHRMAADEGSKCPPIIFQVGQKMPAPEPIIPYVFHLDGEPITLSWSGPDGFDIDHYNIYKFDSLSEAGQRYYPFYDIGEASDTIPPRETSFVNDQWYYYYAMEPYAQIDHPERAFSEITNDSSVYVITAVDVNGLESEFSSEVIAYQTVPKTRDILVINGSNPRACFTYSDTVKNFYNDVLEGYDYGIFCLRDSGYIGPAEPRQLWLDDLLPYKIVIFEDPIRSNLLSDDPINVLPDLLSKYLSSGGTLVYCGYLPHFTNNEADSPPAWRIFNSLTLGNYFGIDSVFNIGRFYYLWDENSLAPPDTLIGLCEVIGEADSIPNIQFDTNRYTLWGDPAILWDSTVAPCPAAFKPDEHGSVTHRLISKYPSTSLAHNEPVGIKTETDLWTTYLYGFHFWYMRLDDSRALIDFMMDRIPTDTDDDPNIVPSQFSLAQNYPNPFNPNTTIAFTLPRRSEVSVDIYNILGQKVNALLNQPMDAGVHKINWDGKDGSGKTVASGIYFYRIWTDDYTEAKKMILLK